jgi:hypothetical protein
MSNSDDAAHDDAPPASVAGDLVHGDKIGGDKVGRDKIVAPSARTVIKEQRNYYPPAITPLDRQQQRNREAMLAKVRLTWIDGVLNKSLFKEARIALDLAEREGAVQRPYEVVRRRPGQQDRPLLPGTRIVEVFDAQEGALLILGAPGSGKTTLLLELARDLLDRAAQDDAHPIPVVFNLSSWVEKRQPLQVWLVDELNQQYDVPQRLARTWVDTDVVLPLLDGLDEVAAEHRPTCTQAINTFRKDHGLVPLVVCCREAEYGALPELRLHGAVVARPLSQDQVRRYLHDAGVALEGLRAALEDDPALWELLDTPLMVSVMTLAYQGKTAATIPSTGTLEQRRQHVFAAYVDAMFERPRAGARYTREQTLNWLAWLAGAMQRANQSIFLMLDAQFVNDLELYLVPEHCSHALII